MTNRIRGIILQGRESQVYKVGLTLFMEFLLLS